MSPVIYCSKSLATMIG